MNVAVIDTCIPPQCIFLLFLHYMSLRSVTGSYDAEEFILFTKYDRNCQNSMEAAVSKKCFIL